MPENNKRPLKVFLCHSSSDKPEVRRWYKRLIADGVDAWLDVESLLPGQKWKEEIPKAIRNSDIVLVFLSKDSISKEGYVQKEIKDALDVADEKPEETIFIIPARLEECEVPQRLADYHWVDLYDEGYGKLIQALVIRAKTIDATLLPAKIAKIDEIKSKAVEFERRGDFLQSLQAYLELRELDPAYSGVEEKIHELNLKVLESQAIRYELVGDFRNAQKTWYEIRKLDPLFPRVDVKIRDLEKELRPKPAKISVKTEKDISPTSPQKVYPQFKPQLLFAIIGAITLLILVAIGSPIIISSINGTPTSVITSTPTKNQVPTKTIAPTATDTVMPTLIPTTIGDGSGKILYVYNNDIYSMNSDGTNPNKLTNTNIVRQIISVSPDSSKVIFDSFNNLFVMNIDGTNIVKLTGKYFGDWLPDGRQFVFEGGNGVFIGSVDGTEYIELTPSKAYGDNFDFVALSPDGTTVWLRSLVAGAYARRPIYSMNIDGTNIFNLTSTAGVDGFGAWSPDGKQVIYHSRSSGGGDYWNYDIFLMNIDGTEQVNLTNGQGSNSFNAWSLDGRKIVFSSNRDGQNDIFIMNKDGSDLIKLTNGIFNAWSLDGSKMLFSSSKDGESDIFIMNKDGSEQINLTTDLAADWVYFCSWSPDGRKILLGNFSDNIPIFYTVNIDGTNLMRVADGNKYQPDCPIWLP